MHPSRPNPIATSPPDTHTPVPESRDSRGPKPKKQDPNFSQSRDVREDRGVRQIKNTIRRQAAPRGR
jgi:hypothetical protein